MDSSSIFYAIGDFMTNYAFIPLELIGNKFNNFLIVVGFFGLFYWLRWQKRFNQEAQDNPGKLK
jgi:hypothetical protein